MIKEKQLQEEEKPVDSMPAWAKDLMAKVEQLENENTMLKEFAGKNKIASWQESQTDFRNKFVHFKKYEGKIVIGWSNLDYSRFNPRSGDALGENIFTTLYLLDGAKKEVNYVMFKNAVELIKCKVLRMGQDFTLIEFPPEVVIEYELPKNHLEVETKFLNA